MARLRNILGLLVIASWQQGVCQNVALTRVLSGLDMYVTEKALEHRFSGVILVAALYPSPGDSAPIFLKAYGQADLVHGISNTAETRFITASVAKSFTAIAILQLAASGRLGLDQPLSMYLPDGEYPHARSTRISIRQLLTHTAGLGNIITSKAFRMAPASLDSLSQLVAMVGQEQPVDTPGAFHYGDSDYVLLGAIIEKVTGQPFAAYMRDHIFQPSGMPHTGFEMSPRPGNLARGYTARNIGNAPDVWPVLSERGDTLAFLKPNDAILPNTGVPGAVAYTSASDLMNFARALAAHTLYNLTPELDPWQGQVRTGQRDANEAYGFGFFVGRFGQLKIINHGGTGPGIDNGFDIYPDLGLVVIILSNLDPPSGQDVRQFVRDGFRKSSNH